MLGTVGKINTTAALIRHQIANRIHVKQWRVSSGGSHMEIQPRDNGAGVKVLYTGGSPCSTGDLASTTIDFVCDLNGGREKWSN